MFAFYFAGYVAVAGLFYFRAYRTAPIMEDADSPVLTLWINPELEGETSETWREAA